MDWISGNIYIRPNPMAKAGDVISGHTHNFDHTSIVFKGAVHVKATLPNGTVIERDFGEGTGNGRHFLVKADVTHEITALADDTEFWCVYSHREPQGDVSEVFTGWEDAYT